MLDLVKIFSKTGAVLWELVTRPESRWQTPSSRAEGPARICRAGPSEGSGRARAPPSAA